MNILAFDTSLNKTYLALKTKGEIYSEIIESTEEKYHSAFLIKKIVEILSNHNLTTKDINLIATNAGPGSFTGIRVGLTVARGLMQGLKIKGVSVNSLELISRVYGLPSVAIIDARKNKAYVGNNEKVELLELEDVISFARNFNGKIIADTKMQEFLKENNINSINFEKDTKDYGTILINLAEEKYSKNEYVEWQNMKALYIQPPPIHVKAATQVKQ